jgi:hypothetical protein
VSAQLPQFVRESAMAMILRWPEPALWLTSCYGQVDWPAQQGAMLLVQHAAYFLFLSPVA